MYSQLFGGKIKAGKKGLRRTLLLFQGREAEYGFSGFITTNKSTKNPQDTHHQFSIKTSTLKQSVKLTLEKK